MMVIAIPVFLAAGSWEPRLIVVAILAGPGVLVTFVSGKWLRGFPAALVTFAGATNQWFIVLTRVFFWITKIAFGVGTAVAFMVGAIVAGLFSAGSDVVSHQTRSAGPPKPRSQACPNTRCMNGAVTCPRCGGTTYRGNSPCTHCHSTGHVRCNVCRGAGHVFR